MTIRAHSLADQRARGLLWLGSLAGVAVLMSASGCSEPTCQETLTCPYDEPGPDGGEPLHDAGDVQQVDASEHDAETDAASDAGEVGDAATANDADAATVGPRIVSISPAPGAKGVRADANIVITFDRPMDKAKTSQAYQSTDIPAIAATVTWNTQGTQLTVNPTVALTYSGGVVFTTPDAIPARAYSFRITSAARDLQGSPLQQDLTSSFTTLRRLAHGVVAKGDAVVQLTSNQSGDACSDANQSVITSYPKRKIFVTFDISAFPSGIVAFEAVDVGANQIDVVEGSYSSGVVIAEHVREPFPLRDPHTAFDTPAVRALGTFSSNANLEYKTVNVLQAVEDDYGDRRQYSQYRIDNSFGPNFARAFFSCTFGFQLSAVYLVP